MLTPGAATVGAIRSCWDGPRDEKPATVSAQASSVNADVSGLRRACASPAPDRCSRRSSPSSWPIITAGTEVPSRPPIVVGGPPALLKITTASAPAAAALPTFTENSQSPRSMSAMEPSKVPSGNAAQPVPLPVSAWCASRTGASIVSVRPGPSSEGTAGIPLRWSGAPVAVTSMVWAKTRLVVVAATAVIHGPVCAAVPAPGPLFPAAAATKVPVFAASRKPRLTGSAQGATGPGGRDVHGLGEDPVGGRGGDGGDPRPGVRRGTGTGTVVSGGCCHEDAGVRGLEEADTDRVGPGVVRTGDGEVDHVDLVGDGLVDPGQDGGDRAVAQAHLVGDEVRPGGHPGHRPGEGGIADDDLGLVHVARRRGCGVAAVAVHVDGAGGAVVEGPRADEFVVADRLVGLAVVRRIARPQILSLTDRKSVV